MKTAFVTGGATGIGAAVIRKFVSEKVRVGFVDNNVDAGETLAAELGPDFVFFLAGDVRDDLFQKEAVKLVTDRFGDPVMVATFRCGMYVLTGLDGIPVARLVRSFPWSAVAGEDTDCNVPVRSGRFWVQPVGTTGSVVVLDVSTPEKPVIVDELAFGVDARPHWLGLEPGGKRIVMTGGGTLAGGVYLIDMDPVTGRLRHAGDLPANASGIHGIRFDRDEWPHGKTGPAFAHGAAFSPVK